MPAERIFCIWSNTPSEPMNSGPPFESRQIHPFCELSPDALPRLNQSLGLDMSVAVFAAIQAVYRRGAARAACGRGAPAGDPAQSTASDAARVGVGEVCTDSDAVAEMWADLMARRRLLAGGVPAPCTLPEIPTATDSYLRRLGNVLPMHRCVCLPRMPPALPPPERGRWRTDTCRLPGLLPEIRRGLSASVGRRMPLSARNGRHASRPMIDPAGA